MHGHEVLGEIWALGCLGRIGCGIELRMLGASFACDWEHVNQNAGNAVGLL